MEKQTQTKNIEKSSYSSPTLNYFGAVTHLTAGGSQSVKESPVAHGARAKIDCFKWIYASKSSACGIETDVSVLCCRVPVVG